MKAICSRESREGVHRHDWDSGEGGLNFPTNCYGKVQLLGLSIPPSFLILPCPALSMYPQLAQTYKFTLMMKVKISQSQSEPYARSYCIQCPVIDLPVEDSTDCQQGTFPSPFPPPQWGGGSNSLWRRNAGLGTSF